MTRVKTIVTFTVYAALLPIQVVALVGRQSGRWDAAFALVLTLLVLGLSVRAASRRSA